MSTSRSSQKDKAETDRFEPARVGDLLAGAAEAFPRIFTARRGQRTDLLLAVAEALMALARMLTNPRDPRPPEPDAYHPAPPAD